MLNIGDRVKLNKDDACMNWIDDAEVIQVPAAEGDVWGFRNEERIVTPNNTVAGLAEKWRAEAAAARKVAETPKSTESGITLCVIAENMEQLAAELEAALAGKEGA